MKRLRPDYKSLQALLGLAVIALQVIGALHFTLVRHAYSAALGGVVHVHAFSRSEQKPKSSAAVPGTETATRDAPACGAELCPVANAPHGSAPTIQSLAAGMVT